MADQSTSISRKLRSLFRPAQRSKPIVAGEGTPGDVLDFLLQRDGVDGVRSYAQLKQDVVALLISGFKRGGYFVEFGATNGISLSNTYLLEKDYGWTGILAEPSVDWHDALTKARACAIDFRCVWRTSGEMIDFDVVQAGVLSTISDFSDGDMHAETRRKYRRMQIETVSLDDLLEHHNAPTEIDYLSVDTEGSEFEILNAVDFSKHRFKFITVEHNFTERRQDIHDLLSGNGYHRILERVSKFDDWYVLDGV